MATATRTTLVETRHVLSEDERQIEQTVLAEIHQLFQKATGDQRETYDTLIAKTPIADGVALEAIDRDGVSGWWVRPAGAPADRAILFLHGGAYMLGSAKAYRGLASQVAVRAGVAAFVADYPLAPEHVFPAAPEAAAALRRWLGGQGVSQVALVGDSAGGALALSVLADTATTSPATAAVAVFSPWLDLALTGPSFTSPGIRDPIFFEPEMLTGPAAAYLAGTDPKDGRASPLYAVPEILPPLLIQVGGDEVLLDDSRRYAQQAVDKGGEVQLDVFEGLHQVFQNATKDLPTARRALDAVAAFLRTQGTKAKLAAVAWRNAWLEESKMPTRCIVSVHSYDMALLHMTLGRFSCRWYGDRKAGNTVSGIANLMRFQNDNFVPKCARCEPPAVIVSEGFSAADKLASRRHQFAIGSI